MLNQQYRDHVREVRERIAAQTPFDILIWGPGNQSDSIHRQKRIAVREALESQFGRDKIHFSEDDSLYDFVEEWGLQAAEHYEADAADVVIVIAESIGSIVELALYGELIAGKSIVFVEKQSEPESGFGSVVLTRLKVEVVESEEWETCERIRRLAKEFSEILRLEKYRKELRSSRWA
jgi:hypothetical protein